MTRAELRTELIRQGGQFPGNYLITQKSNGKKYVGQSKCIVDRIDEHIDKPDKAKDGIDAAIQRYGWEAFDYEVLEALPDATTDQLWYREAVLIEKYDSCNNGYNKTIGNSKHCEKVWKNISKENAKHRVPKEVIKEIPVTTGNKLLIHSYDKKYFDRLDYDGISYQVINKDCTYTNDKGELKENEEALGEYIMAELTKPIIINQHYNEVINNPPYGDTGAEISLKIATEIDYDEFYNLEPGKDYFINGLYKYLDPNFKPKIYPKYSIPDAEQVLVLAKLLPTTNTLSEIEARILLHLKADQDQELYEALKEYILKVNTVKKPLEFNLSKLTRRKTDVDYDENLFMFNSGSYDIGNGYYSVLTRDKINWTDAIQYNVFKKNITTKSDIPAAYVKGCLQFKKILLSKNGFAFMEVLFKELPENWGLQNLFPDIDYTPLTNIVDMFNTIGLSSSSQNTLLSYMSKITLTDKELEICKIVESL